MKNKLCIIVALVLLFGCDKKKQEVVEQSIKIENAIEPITKVNPAVLMGNTGASFLQIFAAHWKLGHWNELIKMTDQQSINKYGNAVLEKKYKKTNLAMKLTLKSIADNEDATYTLNYETDVFATKRILRVKVRVLNNDSVKLVVEDVDNLFQ